MSQTDLEVLRCKKNNNVCCRDTPIFSQSYKKKHLISFKANTFGAKLETRGISVPKQQFYRD